MRVLADLAKGLAPLRKHEPGKHSQKTHGRSRAGGGVAGAGVRTIEHKGKQVRVDADGWPLNKKGARDPRYKKPIAPKGAPGAVGVATSKGKQYNVDSEGWALNKKGARDPRFKKPIGGKSEAQSPSAPTGQGTGTAAKPKTSAKKQPGITTNEPLDATGFKQVGQQAGSNPGGTFEAPNGDRYYIKKGPKERLENEVLANRLYEAAGVGGVPQVRMTTDGRVASKIIPGLEKIPATKVLSTKGIAEAFAADAWTANWDVVGLSHDNLLAAGGRAHRIDAGGALRFRAMGAPKGKAFGKKVTEVSTFRSSTNPQAKSVFGRFTEKRLKASAKSVTGIPNSRIRSIVRSTISDRKVGRELSETLIARKESIREWAASP